MEIAAALILGAFLMITMPSTAGIVESLIEIAKQLKRIADAMGAAPDEEDDEEDS